MRTDRGIDRPGTGSADQLRSAFDCAETAAGSGRTTATTVFERQVVDGAVRDAAQAPTGALINLSVSRQIAADTGSTPGRPHPVPAPASAMVAGNAKPA